MSDDPVYYYPYSVIASKGGFTDSTQTLDEFLNNTAISIELVGDGSSSGSTGGGGGGGGGTTTAPANNTTTDSEVEEQETEPEHVPQSVDISQAFSAGSATISMRLGDSVIFQIGEEFHSVRVKEVKRGSATVTISSNPIDVTLSERESVSLDLTEDGISDILVIMNDISDGEISLTIENLGSSAGSPTGFISLSQGAGSALAGLVGILLIAGLGYWYRRRD